ncbi:MAG: hypothetical protein RLZZ303_1552 [Candidatus Hydrogenedentota bacterium]
MHMTLAGVLETSARLFPERLALIDGPRRVTYLELDQMASRIAGGLASRGISHGQVVALTAPNSVEFVAAFYGVLKTGAAVMPLNTLLRATEIQEQLSFGGASAYLCHPGTPALPCGDEGHAAFMQVPGCSLFCVLADSAASRDDALSVAELCEGTNGEFPGVPCEGHDTAIISFTSGTTGSPKAVCVSHEGEYTCLLGTAASLGFTRDDVMLAAAPLFTSIAQALVLGPTLAAGGCLVLQPRFDALAALEVMAQHRVTLFLGVPTMYHRLAAAAREWSGTEMLRQHWRLGIYGGASMPAEVRQAFGEAVGVPLQQCYGLTETRVTAIGRLDASGLRSPDGLLPAPGFRFRVVDTDMNDVPRGEKGELILRGPGVMKGYLSNDALNADIFRGNWFHTGDVVEHDADGCYYIVARSKDIISRGGFKVYPADVERVLRGHQHVADVVVVGVPDVEYGEEIGAVFVLHPDAAIAEEGLRQWIREALPAHNQPRKLLIRDALPITPTGKVVKSAVLEWFQQSAITM